MVRPSILRGELTEDRSDIGMLARNEALFSLLDGALVLLSLLIYNFIHPLWFFPPNSPEEDETAKGGDESWFDLTPFRDKTMQSTQGKTSASKWNVSKPIQAGREKGKLYSGSSFEGSDNLEWVTENQRQTQMRPLYEGSVYSGK